MSFKHRRIGRPRTKTTERPNHIAEMADRHYEMARMMLLGWSNKEIATALGMTPTGVSGVRRSPVMQKHLSLLSAARDAEAISVGQRLQKIAPASLQVLANIVEGRGEGEGADLRLRASVAKDLLDRAGFGKIQKVQGQFQHGHFIEGVLEKVKARRADQEVEGDFVAFTEVEEPDPEGVEMEMEGIE